MNRIGWRHFICPGCAHNWTWPSRDCFSYSDEACPECNELCIPIDRTSDPTIPHDHLNNLTVPYDWKGR